MSGTCMQCGQEVTGDGHLFHYGQIIATKKHRTGAELGDERWVLHSAVDWDNEYMMVKTTERGGSSLLDTSSPTRYVIKNVFIPQGEIEVFICQDCNARHARPLQTLARIFSAVLLVIAAILLVVGIADSITRADAAGVLIAVGGFAIMLLIGVLGWRAGAMPSRRDFTREIAIKTLKKKLDADIILTHKDHLSAVPGTARTLMDKH
jgi:hypothetical protein